MPPGPVVPGRVRHRRVMRRSRTRRRRRLPRAAAAAAAAASAAAPGSATGSAATCARARTAAPRSRSRRMCAPSLSVLRRTARAPTSVSARTRSGRLHVQGLQCCASVAMLLLRPALGDAGWALPAGRRNRACSPNEPVAGGRPPLHLWRLRCLHTAWAASGGAGARTDAARAGARDAVPACWLGASGVARARARRRCACRSARRSRRRCRWRSRGCWWRATLASCARACRTRCPRRSCTSWSCACSAACSSTSSARSTGARPPAARGASGAALHARDQRCMSASSAFFCSGRLKLEHRGCHAPGCCRRRLLVADVRRAQGWSRMAEQGHALLLAKHGCSRRPPCT